MADLRELQQHAIEAALKWTGPLSEAADEIDHMTTAYLDTPVKNPSVFNLRWNKRVQPKLQQIGIAPHLEPYLPPGVLAAKDLIISSIADTRVYVKGEAPAGSEVRSRIVSIKEEIERLESTLRRAYDRLLTPQRGLLSRPAKYVVGGIGFIILLTLFGPPLLVGFAEKYLGLGAVLKSWCGVETYYDACASGCIGDVGCAILRPPPPPNTPTPIVIDTPAPAETPTTSVQAISLLQLYIDHIAAEEYQEACDLTTSTYLIRNEWVDCEDFAADWSRYKSVSVSGIRVYDVGVERVMLNAVLDFDYYEEGTDTPTAVCYMIILSPDGWRIENRGTGLCPIKD